MIKTFNKHQRWLMIVIAILAIPFVFYFNKTDIGARRGPAGKLYGRDLSDVEIARGARLFDLARDLGMMDLLQSLAGGGRNEEEVKRQFALDLLVLRHEAEALGIRPTSEDAAKGLANLRVFRGENGFDLKKYNDAVQNYLGPRGFSEAQLDELCADQVMLDRIKDILGVGVSISPEEAQKDFDRAYGKVEAAVIRLSATDVANEVKISDDDIAKYYEGHKAQLQSDEKRKVEVASLLLSDEQKKLQGRERVEALQKLSDKANDIEQDLSKKSADFNAVVAKNNLPVVTTGAFTRQTPDPQLKDPQVTEAAFQLTKDDPTSDPLQGADGFYILHLQDVTPPKPLSLEEAKPKIVEALKTSQERELLATRATKISHDLREELKNGQTAAAAAQKLNLKPEKIAPFALADDLDPKQQQPKPETSPDLPMIKRATAMLGANEVSDPIPTANGMMVAIVEKRDLPDASQASARATMTERMLRNRREIAFYEWLRDRRHAAGIVEAPEPAAS